MLQLIFILRRHDDHVRHVAQNTHIECAMMGRPVFRYQARRDQYRRSPEDFGWPHRARPDRRRAAGMSHTSPRPAAFPCAAKPGRKGDGMLFGNAHIVYPVRKLLFKNIEARAFTHGGCNRHDPLILLEPASPRLRWQSAYSEDAPLSSPAPPFPAQKADRHGTTRDSSSPAHSPALFS